VDALRHDGVRFHIHIDAKVDEAPFRRALEERGPTGDVVFAARRFRMNWGGFSLAAAPLSCMREILATGTPDRICSMSGQDYPLISNAAIAEYMARHAGTEFISYGAMPPSFWPLEYMARIERHHFYDWEALTWPGNRTGSRRAPYRLRLVRKVAHWLLPRRSFPAGFTPYAGSAWSCLTGATARRLVEMADAHPELARFYRYSEHADEMYFQTLLLNSGMDPARIRGEYGENALGDYLWFVDWQGQPSPRILREQDLDLLLASGRMFARKFDAETDSRILDLIDEARPGHSLA
jgi:hypothetical protein